MKMNRFIKKIGVLVLTGMLLTGAMTNVVAEDECDCGGIYDYCDFRVYELVTDVVATYELHCELSNGWCEARTSIVSEYDADELRVTASVEADGLYGGVNRETIGEDYEENITLSGREAEVAVSVQNSVDVYYLELTVDSTQSAHFDDGIDRPSRTESFSAVVD